MCQSYLTFEGLMPMAVISEAGKGRGCFPFKNPVYCHGAEAWLWLWQ